VSVAVNFTLHALDTATSTWTARIQVGGASYLDPAGYAFLPANGSATAVSFTHLVDAPAGSTRFQVVITRTAGTGACRTFAQNNAMVLRY
jgi:hypothetical protein